MSTISLRGYNFGFPYPVPYEIQKNYMEKVLTCLDEKAHAVLESPTGTGKTLCLFAPVIAWAKEKKLQDSSGIYYEENNKNTDQKNWGKKKSKVWYTARTHSQIAQSVSEVRKCNIDGLHVAVMGARDQLCINKLVLEEKDHYGKTIKCKELVKAKKCKYFNKMNFEKDSLKFFNKGEVLDIEDLVSVGKSNGVCPYYLAKRGCDVSNIVLLPYNYIIEKEQREINGFNFDNDVIIFDEGHNVPKTCEEGYEFNLNSLDIAIGIKNMQELMLTLTKLSENLVEDQDIDLASHASNSMLIMSVLQKLESEFQNLSLSKELLPLSWLYKFLDNAGINWNTSDQLLRAIRDFKEDSEALTIPGSTLETFKLLEKIVDSIFGPSVKKFDEKVIERSFKCAITNDPERQVNVKLLSLFCFNSSFAIVSLLQLGVQSLIITSGTLSPLKTFISELSLPNPITLENGHIAKRCQVPFMILGTGVNNVKMDGSYKNRNDPKYISSLGMTLTNLIASVPDGVLLLFSSYTMMQSLKESWESNLGIWTRLNALKRVFIEPRNKDDFINCMENYKRAIDAGNGAILMGVLRGKISEGMDFKDQYCRGVFIIGVPFPPIHDPKVQGKEKYAESLTIFNPATKMEEKLYKNSFMAVEAIKTTNQAIGRVIRHGGDYGVIVLIDYRFAWPRLYYNISSWMRDREPTELSFPTAKKLIRDFFRDIHQKKLQVEEIRCQRVDSNGSPIASYVSYEEYDHRKHAIQPVTWIGGSPEETSSPKSQPRRNTAAKPKSGSTIEYVDEENTNDLLSMYKSLSTKVFLPKKTTENFQSSGSLLDVLENSESNGLGYLNVDKNNELRNSTNSKRKHTDDESSENPCTSPSLLSSPEVSQSDRPKKYQRLKVRPLIPFSAQEPEDKTPEVSDKPGVSSTSRKFSKKEEEELKVKLINYYRLVKQYLSKEDDHRFKVTSCGYMKEEASLADVVELMDECFLIPGKKDLFSGFGICIKTRDKEEWKKICSERKVEIQ